MLTFGRPQAALAFGILGLFGGLCGVSESLHAQPAARPVNVDGKVLRNAGSVANDALPGSWLSYGRNQSETRYSTLKQINDTNAKRLGLAWTYVVGAGGGNQEGTPLVVEQHALRHHHLERGLRARRPHRQGVVALGSGSEPDRGAAEDLLRHREPRRRALQRPDHRADQSTAGCRRWTRSRASRCGNRAWRIRRICTR